jgi:hypothetical protein
MHKQTLCVRTLGQITSHGALRQHPALAARIVHPLARILDADSAPPTTSSNSKSGSSSSSSVGSSVEQIKATAELRGTILSVLCGVVAQVTIYNDHVPCVVIGTAVLYADTASTCKLL